jgi:hypothetical protein
MRRHCDIDPGINRNDLSSEFLDPQRFLALTASVASGNEAHSVLLAFSASAVFDPIQPRALYTK